MRTRHRVDGRTVRFEADDGSESILIELSRASLRRGQQSGGPDLIVRSSRARAIAAGPGCSSSTSRAETGSAEAGKAEATAAGIRRYGFKLSE
jgi:hypothetical protein